MEKDKFITILCVIFIIAIFIYSQITQSIKIHQQRIRPITQSILASHHPRIISFYADWCGSCRQFDPALRNTVGGYGNAVDLLMINTDDPKNQQLMKEFNVTGIPATFIFDRHGHQVGDNISSLESLDETIRQLIAQP